MALRALPLADWREGGALVGLLALLAHQPLLSLEEAAYISLYLPISPLYLAYISAALPRGGGPHPDPRPNP